MNIFGLTVALTVCVVHGYSTPPYNPQTSIQAKLDRILQACSGVDSKLEYVSEAVNSSTGLLRGLGDVLCARPGLFSQPSMMYFGLTAFNPALGFAYTVGPDSTKTWDQSSLECSGLGYSLATIDSLAEQQYVRGLLQSHSVLRGLGVVWLSGTDRGHEGRWTWIGPPERNMSSEFTYWQRGEPNNHGGSEHCLMLWRDRGYKWNDAACSARGTYVCKRPIELCSN